MDLALNELYGLGYDFSERYEQAIFSVTPEAARAAARKYLAAEPFIVVLKGETGETSRP